MNELPTSNLVARLDRIRARAHSLSAITCAGCSDWTHPLCWIASELDAVLSGMRTDETSALPHASAALKDFMVHLGEIMSMEDGATPADYLQRARDIREWCHDHQTLPKLEYSEHCGCCVRNKITVEVFGRPAVEPTPPHPGPSIAKAFANSPRRIGSGAPRGEAGDRAGPQVSPLPHGFITVAQCASCCVQDFPGARHHSQCACGPGELVRPENGTPEHE